jgi:hypothetical protein
MKNWGNNQIVNYWNRRPAVNQVVQTMKNEKTVEIVVHVDEELDEGQRSTLTSELKNIDGITDAEFCPLRWHLMLVRYNTRVFSSPDVLKKIVSHDVHAQLIGPV